MMELELQDAPFGCRVGLVKRKSDHLIEQKRQALTIMAPSPTAALALMQDPKKNIPAEIRRKTPQNPFDDDDWYEKGEEERTSHSSKRGSFHSTKTYDEYVNIAMHDPLKLISWTKDDEKLVGPVDGRDTHWDVTGQWLDVPRYIMGEPEVFGSPAGDGTPRGFVQLVHSASYAGVVNKESIRREGSDLLTMIDRLESHDIRVGFYSVASMPDGFVITTVKEFGAPFDAGNLAIALHPDWLRRFIFNVQEWAIPSTDTGYGNADHCEKDTQALVKHHASLLGIEPPSDALPTIHVGSYTGYSQRKADELREATEDLIQNLGVWS